MSYTQTLADVRIAALTVYGEARGEDFAGKVAVAWTFLSRAYRHRRGNPDHPMYWGGPDLASVCRHKAAYSCWLESDPNCALLGQVDDDDPVFTECLNAVAAAIAGTEPDPTFGSTHYLADGASAFWAEPAGRRPVYRHGRHRFFNDVP